MTHTVRTRRSAGLWRGAEVEGVQLGIIGAWDPHVAASTKFRRKPAPGLATCHSELGDRSQAPQFSAALRIAANQSTGILFVTFTPIQAGDDYTARDRRPTCVLESFAGVTVLGTPTFFTRPRVNRDDCRIRSREKQIGRESCRERGCQDV